MENMPINASVQRVNQVICRVPLLHSLSARLYTTPYVVLGFRFILLSLFSLKLKQFNEMTFSIIGDAGENSAIKTLLGQHSRNVQVSSTKGGFLLTRKQKGLFPLWKIFSCPQSVRLSGYVYVLRTNEKWFKTILETSGWVKFVCSFDQELLAIY